NDFVCYLENLLSWILQKISDVGSGLSVYSTLNIMYINVNFLQLKTAAGLARRGKEISSSNAMNSKKTHPFSCH
ncbi:MAG: hypothetical protein WBE61_08490, partial [Nitrososphaeraceae archaeon]